MNTFRTTLFTIGLSLVIISGCASEAAEDPPNSTTTTEEARTEPVTTRTTERATTTTTVEEVSDYDIGMLAVSLAMCSTYGTDPGFAIDWCGLDSSSSVLKEMVTSGCDLIGAIDPYKTMSDEEIIEMYALLSVDAINSGSANYDEVSTMATLNGAILAVRGEVC